MNRVELEQYIDHCNLLGNIVTEDSAVYKVILDNPINITRPDLLLGAVCIEDNFYVKKDNNNKIHLVYYDGCYERLDFGDTIDIIDAEVFQKNSALRFISGSSVIEIGYNAFYYADYLREIKFPNVETIGVGCFQSTCLREVTLNKLKAIPTFAFGYSYLKSFKGENVGVVEPAAFHECEYLTSLILPKVKYFYTKKQGVAPYYLEGVNDLQVPENCSFKRDYYD